MKPLMIMLVYNRLQATQQVLSALRATVDLDAVDMHVINNGSTDGSMEWLSKQAGITVDRMETNIGVSRGLNYALQRYRQLGQVMIKIDNDVEVLTKGWLDIWLKCLEESPSAAMIGSHNPDPAYMEGVQVNQAIRQSVNIAGYNCWLMSTVLGSFTLHSGAFLDEVGFFDVLAPHHIYGYEDLLLCLKAHHLGYTLLLIQDIQWRPVPSTPSLSDIGLQNRLMEPLYVARSKQLHHDTNTIYTNSNGRPR